MLKVQCFLEKRCQLQLPQKSVSNFAFDVPKIFYDMNWPFMQHNYDENFVGKPIYGSPTSIFTAYYKNLLGLT